MRTNEQNKCCCMILNYNDAPTTEHLLDLIKDYKIFEHIIVVDNNSTDDSRTILKKKENEKVYLIFSDKNGGYGYGNNLGVKYASENFNTEYLLIANPDVEFSEDTIKSMVEYLQENKAVAVVAPMQLDSNGNLIKDIAWKVPTINQYIYSAGMVLGKILRNTSYAYDEIKEREFFDVECVPGSLLLVRVESFLSVGGYDEEMFLYCEETTLGYKLKCAGYRSMLMTKKTYVHQHSVSISKTIKSAYKRRKVLLQSRMIFLKKYLHANKFQCFIASVVFKISELEQIVLQFIRNIL